MRNGRVDIRDGRKTVRAFSYPTMFMDVQIAKNFFGEGEDAVVVVANGGGSGGYADWHIVGLANGFFQCRFSRVGVFQAGIRADGKVIQECKSSQCTRFGWQNGRVVKLRDLPRPKPGPGKRIVSFEITPKETVRLSGAEKPETAATRDDRTAYPVRLKVGEILVLYRANKGISERIMGTWSENPVLGEPEAEGQSLIFKALREGREIITIIPGGYNWENAVELCVIVN